MLMRVRTSIYQICRRPSARRATAAASVCLPPIWYTAGWLYVKNERTTCTKVGMTFSELDVSLKVSHDECFRVKFEQDISWWIFFLSIHLLFPPPPLIFNYFLLGLSSYCVKFAAKTEEDLEPLCIWCFPPPPSYYCRLKNHRRLISSFSIIINIFYHHLSTPSPYLMIHRKDI